MIITLLAVIFFFLITSFCCWQGTKYIFNKSESKTKTYTKTDNTVNYYKYKRLNKPLTGGYCSSSCRHYREEIIDPEDGIVADYTSNSYSEYYCSLGHSLYDGHYCNDYE